MGHGVVSMELRVFVGARACLGLHRQPAFGSALSSPALPRGRSEEARRNPPPWHFPDDAGPKKQSAASWRQVNAMRVPKPAAHGVSRVVASGAVARDTGLGASGARTGMVAHVRGEHGARRADVSVVPRGYASPQR